MKPLTKILLTLGMSILFIGVVMCGVAYVVSGMDLGKLDIDTEYVEQSYISESPEIEKIELDTDSHDIVIKQSATVRGIVVSYAENEYDLFSVTEKVNKSDNVRTITISNKYSKNKIFREFCMLLDKNNKTQKIITVTVPKFFNGTIKINSSDADVNLNSVKNIQDLDIELSNGDIMLSSLSCKKAFVSLSKGELNVDSGFYESLDITLTNQAKYVPEKPLYTPSADDETSQTATPDIDSPDATTTPEATDSTLAPVEMPSPIKTPKPTKTPMVLSVTKAITFKDVDCKNLNIVAYNTNIEGSIARNILCYEIVTNNKETSNIRTKENDNAEGKIIIEQHGGATSLNFLP